MKEHHRFAAGVEREMFFQGMIWKSAFNDMPYHNTISDQKGRGDRESCGLKDIRSNTPKWCIRS